MYYVDINPFGQFESSLGGPKWTVDRTVFEMWLGAL